MRYDINEDHFLARHVLFAASPCKVFGCHFLRGTWTWQDRNLAAPHWRFYWNPTGNAAVHFGEQVIELDSKTIALIPPNIPFSKSATTFVEHFHIHFTANSDVDRALGKTMHRLEATPSAVSAMREIIALLSDNCESSIVFQMALVNLISRALLEVSRGFPEASVRDLRIINVCNYMNEHFAEQIENECLAKIAGMNTNAFIRFFKGALGNTPRRYIMKKRIDHASTLLAGGDLSIEQIAERTGFCDRNHFTTVFTREMKTSPAAFRKRDI